MNHINFSNRINTHPTGENSSLSAAEKRKQKIATTNTSSGRLEAAKQQIKARYDLVARRFANVMPEAAKILHAKSVEDRWNHIQKKIFDPLNENINSNDFSRNLETAIEKAKIESQAAIQRLEIDAQRSLIMARRSDTDTAPRAIQQKDGSYTLIRKAPPIENLVLKGGGAKGISYGAALEQFEESGYLDGLKRVAGSSAGALTATCMACGVTSSHIDKVESDKLFKSAITAYWNDPENNIYPDLEFANARGLFKALRAVHTTDTATAEEVHEYLAKNWKTETFQQRLLALIDAQKEGSEFTLDHIANRLDILRRPPDFQQSRVDKMITFKDISLLHQLAPETFKELTLTAWDPENKCSIYFDEEKTPDIPICYAARASMSFPVGFKPVRMDLGDGHGKRNLIDGGVGTNLPTEVFIHPPTTNADSNASNSDSIHDDSLSAAKSLIFTFDMQGNAYRVMYQANFTTPESKQAEQDARTAKKNPLITRVLTWFLGKDPFETDTNDSEKIWNAGPNALPVFHDTIGTMNVKISDTSAHAARLQAATEALEQIRARENQAYYSDFNSLDELVRNLSNDEKQAILKYVAARPKDSLNSATATDTALNRVDIAREKKSPAKKRASQARTRADSATEATTYIDIFGKAKNVKEKAEKAEKKVKFATASVTRALKSVDAAEKNANKEQELLQKIADILEPQSPQ